MAAHASSVSSEQELVNHGEHPCSASSGHDVDHEAVARDDIGQEEVALEGAVVQLQPLELASR